jgi:chromosomal replication initiation ATPase DnaA
MRTPSCIFPPLPSQPIKSLDERLAEADAVCQDDPPLRRQIKKVIRKSAATECGEIAYDQPIKQPKISDIQKLVARHFGVNIMYLISHRRTANVALPRIIAMYLCAQLTTRTTTEISRHFDDRDHTTILNAVRKITRLLETDKRLVEEIAALRGMLEL